MRGPEGEEVGGDGCYLEVVPNERLIWTDALLPGYRPSPQPFFTGVILMKPEGSGTRYTAMALHRDPEGWARKVAAAAGAWGADRVVAEKNNGGDMVASVLRSADVALPVKLVSASRGKVARAEPVAARVEAGAAFFAGRFPALEDELAGLILGGGYAPGGLAGRSPDRADAMVWAMTELLRTPRAPSVRGF